MFRKNIAATAGFALLLGAGFTTPVFADRNDNDPRVRRGLEISPVPMNMRGKKPAAVGLGSYLVNAVGGCNDCHTNPSFIEGGNPFLGQPKIVNAENFMAGGAVYGPFVSRNITPDAQGRPAGLSESQFKEVLKTGRDFKLRHPQISPLLQVMPWPVYGNMTDKDMEAIYEYLSSIPHAEPRP